MAQKRREPQRGFCRARKPDCLAWLSLRGVGADQSGAEGPPTLQEGHERDVPARTSFCGGADTRAADEVPSLCLGVAWPTGQLRPAPLREYAVVGCTGRVSVNTVGLHVLAGARIALPRFRKALLANFHVGEAGAGGRGGCPGVLIGARLGLVS